MVFMSSQILFFYILGLCFTFNADAENSLYTQTAGKDNVIIIYLDTLFSYVYTVKNIHIS